MLPARLPLVLTLALFAIHYCYDVTSAAICMVLSDNAIVLR